MEINNNKCSICGEPGQEIHHVNMNRKDNRHLNLQLLCEECHCRHHKIHGKSKNNETIVFEIDEEQKYRLKEFAFNNNTTIKNLMIQSIDMILKKGAK